MNEGARLCREHDVDFVLAVGGGSVIDCAKAICAARYYDGDAWDIVTDPSKITKALPLVTVLTLSATGSEYDPAAVISNMDENKKIGVLTPVFYPRVSICDPEYTFSVSKKQTAAGCAPSSGWGSAPTTRVTTTKPARPSCGRARLPATASA